MRRLNAIRMMRSGIAATRAVALICLMVLVMGGCVFRREAHYTLSASTKSLFSADQYFKPIRVPRKAYTQREFGRDMADWLRRKMLENYQKIGLRNPAWDPQAVAFIEQTILSMSKSPDAPTKEQLLSACAPLLKAGCNDPLILYLIGNTQWLNGKLAEAEAPLRQSVEGYRNVPYARGIARGAPKILGVVLRGLGHRKEQEAEQWLDLAIQWTGEAVQDGSYAAKERRLFCDSLLEDLNGPLETRASEVYRVLAAQPGVDPWLLDVVGGEMNIVVGWQNRGCGWASTVTPERWAGLEMHLKVARQQLTRAWKLHPEDPEAPALMMGVLRGSEPEPGETSRLWFDRSIVRCFDYPGGYKDLLEVLLPRWGGSHEELYAFGLQCLATKRFDTNVPHYLMEAVCRITYRDGETEFWRRPGVYGNLCAMFQGYLADPFWKKSLTRLETEQAFIAWQCGEYRDARKILDKLGSNYHRDTISEFKVRWDMLKGEVMAATGRAGKEVQEAEKLYRADRRAEAYALFEKAARIEQDRLAMQYLRDRMETTRVERFLAKGKWVDLSPLPRLAGWEQVQGNWTIEPQGPVKCFVAQGNTFFLHKSDLGDNFEVKGELKLDPGAMWYCADFVLSVTSFQTGYDPYMFIRLTQWSKPEVILYKESTEMAHSKPGLMFSNKNSFRFVFWNSSATMYVNDKLVFAKVFIEPQGTKASQNRFGFQSIEHRPNASLRLMNLQVRKLTQAPKTTTVDGKGL